MITETEAESRTARVGKRARVVRGRKVPLGTEGTVIWVGPNRYRYYGPARVGLRDDAGAVHWTSESNLEFLAATEPPDPNIHRGDRVQVVREAPGAPLGASGEVFWVGRSRSGRLRVGLKGPDQRVVWAPADSVTVMSV